jgi:Fe-S cluster assembly iron-binding protein IscA
LAMALDEPKESDIKFEQEGLTFVVDKQLANYLPYVTVGYRNSWLGKGLFVESGRFGC